MEGLAVEGSAAAAGSAVEDSEAVGLAVEDSEAAGLAVAEAASNPPTRKVTI